MTRKPIPVILDTDIGSDIDDTWALAQMLKSPELDVKLIVSATQNTHYRAQLIAKLLEVAGRTDIPVGVGVHESDEVTDPQRLWLQGYDLYSYPGTVHEDGVGAIIDTIEASEEPVTLICIGPLPNIAEALRRSPGIAGKTHFVGMHGSIARGHGGKPTAEAEYNVVADVPACQATFTAPWLSRTITPLDTCALVKLTGERYSSVCDCKDPLTTAVIENYRAWLDGKPDTESSVLFDTVAVHLAFSREFLRMEKTGIRVTDDGFTVRDAAAPEVEVAIEWEDLPGYMDYLVERLVIPASAIA